ncbi:MAG: DNA polymerase III [Candidatus Muproteobacteria bacterium RBG_16_60_9]|uniref:DNA polymerase beta n=1 Tax=Candidatus Muproteobacteria bacterium RBG_16_60_9 TaxID=1817755 RepID=A0A1F6V3I9_9PROT|nr:MAG: DNA polymerase III [Candidatus Muproteobacteria bacterium RBG_16_60_9]
MPIHNADIAAVFDEIADLLEIDNANPFRVRAYRNAARQIQGMGVAAADMVNKEEDLTELPGIGEDLAAKIVEIVETGKCQALDKLRKQMPPTITALLKIPGLGPKRVRVLYKELDVETMEQLARAARDGRIRELPGFGPKIEQTIRDAIAAHAGEQARFKLAIAAQYAETLKAYLEKIRAVRQVEIAGSYRRSKETVGDLDLVVTATDAATVMDCFVAYEEVKNVLAKGSTRATVILKCGLQIDLRVVEPASYGAALLYFTGSKAHNIEVRRLAQERGLKINEYGVFRGDQRIAGDTEKSVYASVGLPWIAPELRENRGEIEAAHANKLPKLIELSDLKGDLHAHTKATDGHHTLKEMAEAAKAHGLAYLAITEHSRRLTVAKGLDPQHLRRQLEEIDRLNATLNGITLLKGIEVDILEDGALDLPDDVLGELDLVVGAVHSKFELARAKQTNRILRAMDHPYFHILAHPTGRLLDTREPYDVDMLKIIRHARGRGCFLELNAHPERLDLLDVHCQMAKDEGVLVAINSDAHSVQDFDNLIYGVGQARRGWLEAKDVLNTRPLAQLRALLRGVARAPTKGKSREKNSRATAGRTFDKKASKN